MARSTPEWIAKSDDQKIPDRVRVRVFERFGGKDYITGQKIMPGMSWEIEHRVALINGGEHRESNMAPILPKTHKAKTKADMALKSKIARTSKKHLGLGKSSRPLQSRGFPKAAPQHSATRPIEKEARR